MTTCSEWIWQLRSVTVLTHPGAWNRFQAPIPHTHIFVSFFHRSAVLISAFAMISLLGKKENHVKRFMLLQARDFVGVITCSIACFIQFPCSAPGHFLFIARVLKYFFATSTENKPSRHRLSVILVLSSSVVSCTESPLRNFRIMVIGMTSAINRWQLRPSTKCTRIAAIHWLISIDIGMHTKGTGTIERWISAILRFVLDVVHFLHLVTYCT